MLNEENNGYIPVEPFLSLETPLLVKKVYEEYTTKGRKNTTQEEPGRRQELTYTTSSVAAGERRADPKSW